MDIVFDGLPSGFFGGLEQRADIDVETDIGEGRGDDLGAAVVAVLAQLYHQHAGPPAFAHRKGINRGLDSIELGIAGKSRTVNPGDRANFSAVAGKFRFQRIGNFAHRRARPRGIDGQGQKVPGLIASRRAKRFQGRPASRFVPAGAHLVQAANLRLAHRRVVDIEDIHIVLNIGR